MSCELELFSGLTVSNGTERISSFKVKEAGWILAFLSFYPDRRFGREYIAEIFWPHRFAIEDDRFDPDKGIQSFTTAFRHLRDGLESIGLDPQTVVDSDQSNIWLNSSGLSSDVGAFLNLVNTASIQTPERMVERLTRAMSLYKGDLLPGVHLVWVIVKQDELRTAYYPALLALVRQLALKSEWQRAQDACFNAMHLDQLRELPHRLLMEVFYRQARFQEAIDHFSTFEELPRKAADSKPSSGIRRFSEEIQSAITGQCPPNDRFLQYLIKDTLLNVSVPPTSPVQPQPAPRREPDRIVRLPRRTGQFFGREEEIHQIERLLAEPCTVTLVGMAGVGKTRLSSECAERVAQNYSAVIFVPLESATTSDHILEQIVTRLGIDSPPDFIPIQKIVAAISGRRALLILDNVEQAAESAAEVIPLLRKALPQLTCLVTSQCVLGIDDAREIHLEALSTPTSANRLDNDSVRLFIDRAKPAWPAFEVTDQNRDVIAEICTLLEGLPLAIVLAAARVQSLDLDALRSGLREQVFDTLSQDQDGVDRRHRTLRAAFNWTYRLLPPNAAVAFTTLSIFRGGWTREAAAAVCGADDATLNCLARFSMIEEEPTPLHAAPGSRQCMLEILRQFADDLLSQSKRRSGELGAQHAEYYFDLAKRACDELRGSAQGEWLNRLDADHDNIQHVLERTKGADPELALRLGSKLPLFWDLRGYWRVGYHCLTDLLERNQKADPRLRAEASSAAGNLAQRLGKYLAAERFYREAIDLSKANGLRQREGMALNNIGILHKELGRFTEAIDELNESLTIRQEMVDSYGEGLTLTNFGNLYFHKGDYEPAASYLDRAIPILRAVGATHVLANALNNLGAVILAQRDDYAAARPLLESALRIRCEIDDRNGQAYSFDSFARLVHAERNPKAATRLLAAAQSLRTIRGFRLTPVEQSCHDEFIEILIGDLGAQSFDYEWSCGASLSPDQAVASVSGGGHRQGFS